jgi:hypothetical protein
MEGNSFALEVPHEWEFSDLHNSSKQGLSKGQPGLDDAHRDRIGAPPHKERQPNIFGITRIGSPNS